MYIFKTSTIATCIACVCLTLTSCEYLEPKHISKSSLEPIGIPKNVKQEPVLKGLQNRKPTDEEIHAKSKTYPAVNSVVSGPGIQNKNQKTNEKGSYTLNFDDADMGEVAKTILSDSLGLNYVISPKVTGKVTLQTSEPLTREELLPTLETVLKMNNAALVKDGKTYRIEPVSDALYSSNLSSGSIKEGYQKRVIPIKNVAAIDIAELMKPLVHDKTILNVDRMQNLLTVSGTPDEIAQVMDMVNTFDIDILKGRSFGLFYLAHVDAADIIPELESIFETKNDKKNSEFFRFIAIDRLHAILAITHQAHYLNDIEKWVIRLDKANSQSGGGVNVYRVQHVDAVVLADTLNAIFGNGSVTKKDKSAKVAPGQQATQIGNQPGSQPGSQSGSSQSSIQPSAPKPATSSTTGSGQTGDAKVANVGSVKVIADEPNNSLIIVSTPQEYQIIRPIIAQLDVMPLQVLIDVTMVEVDLNNDLAYGLQWSLESGRLGNLLSNSAISSIASIPAFPAAAGYSLFLSGGTIKAVLSALATKGQVKVIASPSFMVLNNQEAFLNVGDKVPVSTGQITSSVTSTPAIASSIQMIDTGIIMKITPRVNAGGLVIMQIQQEDNQAILTNTSTLNSPTIQQRKINSSIAVKNGETIVLGGLIQETVNEKVTGIPFLSTLPYVGPLFGTTIRNHDRTELVVLITPRVVQNAQTAREVTQEFKHKLTDVYQDHSSGL